MKMSMIVFLIGFLYNFALSQDPPKIKIYGRVLDNDKAPVKEVIVAVDTTRMTTLDDGSFTFSNVRSGNRAITFKKKGYRTQQKNIEVHDTSITIINIDNFQRTSAFINEMNSNERNPTQITKRGVNTFASVSKENQKIAVELFDEKTNGVDIWILDPAGNKLKAFSTMMDDETNPVWSPAGDQIVYAVNANGKVIRHSIFIKSIDPVSVPIYIDDGITPSWSNDGQWIVYSKNDHASNWTIWKKNILTKDTIQLTSDEGWAQFPWPGTFRGQDVIVYAYCARKEPGNFEVWIMNANGGDKKQLSNVHKNLVGPVVSPDGKQILCWSYMPTDTSSIWLIKDDGENPNMIIPDGINPQWIDNFMFVFASERSGQFQIWKYTIQ